ncbi:hypothetical protein HDV00_004766 [Rhizophlyctis rosea]|nr:hypothetical protein HDV00_004766 [Rhizophlyctis rosea]
MSYQPPPGGAPPHYAPPPGQPYPPPGQQHYAPPPTPYGQPPATGAPPAEGEKAGYAAPQQPVAYPSPAGQYPAPPAHPQYAAPHPGQQPHHPAPQFGQPAGAAASLGPVVGDSQGVHYEIMYRDCNTMVKFVMQPNVAIKAKAGSMVAHSANIKLEGKMKLKNMFTPGETFSQTFTAANGPGEVFVAPDMYADVICLELNGRDDWIIGGGFLASTMGVNKSTNVQNLGQAFFSGEGLFVTRLSGQGLAFVSSLGAIHPIDLAPGQDYIVDNGHLVAWHASVRYTLQSAGGGIMGAIMSGEGKVCRFTGPGRVYIQTRNPLSLGAWIAANSRQNQG